MREKSKNYLSMITRWTKRSNLRRSSRWLNALKLTKGNSNLTCLEKSPRTCEINQAQYFNHINIDNASMQHSSQSQREEEKKQYYPVIGPNQDDESESYKDDIEDGVVDSYDDEF